MAYAMLEYTNALTSQYDWILSCGQLLSGIYDWIFAVALYLIDSGCGGDKERGKLLCGACYWGKLDMVKELVKQHKANPNSECVY